MANSLVLALIISVKGAQRVRLVYKVPDDSGKSTCGAVENDITVRLESFIYYDGLVTSTTKSTATPPRRIVRDVLIYGICGGVLIVVLKLTEYRFLIVDHSVEIYGALVATLFAGLGIWLGWTLTRKKPAVIIKEVPAPAASPFAVDEARVSELGITPRELEILGLIAAGLSTREMAARLFVSENTVKTHSSRLFEKLGARRRTQAVQIGKAARLIP
jgi:DNA-binding CsgD family transcriptional regulator